MDDRCQGGLFDVVEGQWYCLYVYVYVYVYVTVKEPPS